MGLSFTNSLEFRPGRHFVAPERPQTLYDLTMLRASDTQDPGRVSALRSAPWGSQAR